MKEETRSLQEVASELVTFLRELEKEIVPLAEAAGRPGADHWQKVKNFQVRFDEWWHKAEARLRLYDAALAGRFVSEASSYHSRDNLSAGLRASVRACAALLDAHAGDPDDGMRFPQKASQGPGISPEELAALPLATVLRALRVKHVALLLAILGAPLTLGAGAGFAWGRFLEAAHQEALRMRAEQSVGAAQQATATAEHARVECALELARLRADAAPPSPLPVP